RRRHTRFSRDWSSDVCSSDLPSSVMRYREISSEAIRKSIPELRGFVSNKSFLKKIWLPLTASIRSLSGKYCARYFLSPSRICDVLKYPEGILLSVSSCATLLTP